MLEGRSVKISLPPRIGALLAVTFWGISFVATKAALRQLEPVTLIFTRFALGTALLFILARWRGPLKLPPRDAWPMLVLMGLSGVFIHQMLQAFGLRLTTAVQTGWLIGLIPVWSALLAAALGRERFGPLKILGLAGGFAGAALLLSRGRFGLETFKLPATRGDFLILLSTINWAAYSLLAQGTVKRLGPARATAWSMLCGWLMIAPFFVAQQGWREIPGLSLAGWGALLFLGIGCSALGYLFWYGALERIEVSRVAAFLYLEPLVTLATAVLLLSEPVSATAVVGGLIVLGSVYVMQLAK
jgi:drug/metabolite transporter (DMT)-like permease